MSERPVLRRGATGAAVFDLQSDLAAAGLPIIGDPARSFGASTEECVRAFQRSRGLQVDGICGRDTWAALAESKHRAGTRLLSSRRPMLRGDDVRDLQHALCSLGFDSGREDGIFGPRTETALRAFQRDAAVAADGVCGPETLDALHRWGSLAAGSIATVRERETIRAAPRRFDGRVVLVVARDDFAGIGRALVATLSALGAHPVLAVAGLDDVALAAAADTAGADLCFLLQPFSDATCRVAYYGTATYQSLRGYAIAARVDEALGEDFGESSGPVARTFGILRETRMAAVVCQPDAKWVLGSESHFVERVCDGIRQGFELPPST